MRQGLQVAGEPMKRILCLVLIPALGLGACHRHEARTHEAALDACRSTKALMAVRRAVLQEAATEGAPQVLIGRLKREARFTLEDAEVSDYDDDTRVASCAAQLVITPPGGQTATSRVTYDAEPLRRGSVYRFRITDIGQTVAAISGLRPLPPEAPAASSTAADAAATAPASDADIDPQVREDAAAVGDTGRTHRPPAAVPAPAPEH